MDRSECPLTQAEYDTLLLVMQGCSYKEAALRRGVAHSTIRTLLHTGYRRLGVSNVTQAATMMLREGWATDEQINPHYFTWLEATRRELGWRPSAAQRCYLTAFDRLLRRRDAVSAAALDLAFRLMCWEAGVGIPRPAFDRERAADRLDAMLLSLARGVMRPIPA